MGSVSPEQTKGWSQADTIAVWAWDREGEISDEHGPILIAVEEWESVGLRGVHVVGIWSPFQPFSKEQIDDDLRRDLESWQQEGSGSWRFSELVRVGQLHFVGRMPSIPGYDPK